MKAFTLIELIVVIAIIGILMAILIPNLISYIKDARTSTSNSNAGQVYKFSSSYMTKVQLSGATVSGISDKVIEVLDPTGLSMDESYNETGTLTIDMFQRSLSVNISTVGIGAVFAVRLDDENNVIKAWWAENSEDTLIGSYPAPRTISQNDGTDVLSGTVPADW
jgi:type IV pilus assembly protein PilA